ncbi:MAG: hypothetical protein ACI4F0_02845 [Agathobacter sp.]
MNTETYSKEVEIKKKKVTITLEFPGIVDQKKAQEFGHMLKTVYLDNIQKKAFLQAPGENCKNELEEGRCRE